MCLAILPLSAQANLSDEQKLKLQYYKRIILSRDYIRDNFKSGDAINRKIKTYFIVLQIKNNEPELSEKLTKLQERLEPVLISLREKKVLTKKEAKTLNLAENLYLRTRILLDY
ncbi:MAG: hypothetical protein H6767_06060 [Candidatus Peribacteria bacterium]|nr:MAG: hypothetical protein H6767_06060 [Candidatus Peribacteria bacterium]